VIFTLFRNILRTLRRRERATPGLRAAHLRDADAAESTGDMDALAAAGEALRSIDPDDAHAYRCLAIAALGSKAPQLAIRHAHKAFQLAPGDADIAYHWAVALHYAGRITEAMQIYAHAIEMDPAHQWARARLGMLRLLRGDFSREAWNQYLANLDIRNEQRTPGRAWDGAPHPTETLHVYGHQGLGDQILFGSCLADVLPQFAQVVVHLDARLTGLFARAFPAARVVALDSSDADPAPTASPCAPMAQLAAVHSAGRECFPDVERFLLADEERTARWRARLGDLGDARLVGISWRGGTARTRAQERSTSLSDLAPLLGLPGVRFVSLQYGACVPEIEAFRQASGVEILHWPEAIDDYEETAALASALDHVVSVTTSLVHLCGALGVPVSVLVDRAAQWRYGTTGDRMPWYRSVRLFRQSVAGDWRGPLEAVVDTVRALPPRGAGPCPSPNRPI